MMLADQFTASEQYHRKEFQATPFDRPLVSHFAASDPKALDKAACQSGQDSSFLKIRLLDTLEGCQRVNNGKV